MMIIGPKDVKDGIINLKLNLLQAQNISIQVDVQAPNISLHFKLILTKKMILKIKIIQTEKVMMILLVIQSKVKFSYQIQLLKNIINI